MSHSNKIIMENIEDEEISPVAASLYMSGIKSEYDSMEDIFGFDKDMTEEEDDNMAETLFKRGIANVSSVEEFIDNVGVAYNINFNEGFTDSYNGFSVNDKNLTDWKQIMHHKWFEVDENLSNSFYTFPFAVSEFYRNRFRSKAYDKGLKAEDVIMASFSRMVFPLVNTEKMDPNLVYLFNLGLEDFKTLRFFSSSSTEFLKLIDGGSFMKVKQALENVPKLFYMAFSAEFNLTRQNFSVKFREFKNMLNEQEEYNEEYIVMSFVKFKMDILVKVYMSVKVKDADCRMSEVENQSIMPKTEIMKLKRKLDRQLFNIESLHLSKFQPDNNTRDFFRNLDPYDTHPICRFSLDFEAENMTELFKRMMEVYKPLSSMEAFPEMKEEET